MHTVVAVAVVFFVFAILAGVVCWSHGWWEACPDLGLPGFDPFAGTGANQKLLVLTDQLDHVSGVRYVREGDDIVADGLFIGLASWAAHVFVWTESHPKQEPMR